MKTPGCYILDLVGAKNVALGHKKVFISFADLRIFKTILCCGDTRRISPFKMLFYATWIWDALEAETDT